MRGKEKRAGARLVFFGGGDEGSCQGEKGARVECGGGGGGACEAGAHRALGNAWQHGLSGQLSKETTRLAPLTVQHLRRAGGHE